MIFVGVHAFLNVSVILSYLVVVGGRMTQGANKIQSAKIKFQSRKEELEAAKINRNSQRNKWHEEHEGQLHWVGDSEAGGRTAGQRHREKHGKH